MNRDSVHRFHDQDFKEIKKWCLNRKLLFEDPYFKRDLKYEWKRPGQIVDRPRLFVDGPCRFDVRQGQIGNCWMLAAISNLAMYQDLVKTVVPMDQDFSVRYAGIFHFRFWRFGNWFDVVIDDRLPTMQGRLVFTHSETPNEFWSALLEKAYCKVLGDSYSAGEVGNMCEALEDFTGGVVEQFYLRVVSRDFQQLLIQAMEKRSLVGCFIDDLPGTRQTVTPFGLVRGHSYSVTAAKPVLTPSYGNIVLVRLRNPWGMFEWTGPWSDSSPQWKSVPDKTKQKLGMVNRNDGEFWMSYNDFVSNFEWVDMCHLNPDAFTNAFGRTNFSVAWELTMFRDQWVLGLTAGGSNALHMNPQIRFILREADAGTSSNRSSLLCSVLIALIQKTSNLNAGAYNEIAFKIFFLNDRKYDNMPLDRNFFLTNQAVAQVFLKRTREVAGRFILGPGVYCVIPFTTEADKVGEFLLRIFSEKRTEMYQVGTSVMCSEVNVNTGEAIPVLIPTHKLNFKKDETLKEHFDKISKRTNEVDWKGLKNMLDFAVKNEFSQGKSGIIPNVIWDIASFVYSMMFNTTNTSTKNAFDTLGPGGFPVDICRSIIAFLDMNHSGKILFGEFVIMWEEIKKWKSLYEKYTLENEAYLTPSGFKVALEEAGFILNNRILRDLIHQYAIEDGKIPFDEFVCCNLKLRTMSEIFRSKDEYGVRRAEFSLEDFLEKTMYS